ncbi:MAG: hypothetical protein ACTSSF_10155 [Candidatus Heimdallarchaeaceae archaeon]
MIRIELDMNARRKIATIQYVGSVIFPAHYTEHLLNGLTYTSFLPFISTKPNRLFFIYWQATQQKVCSLEEITELRERLVFKYYRGDTMKVKDYEISDFKGKEARILSGTWKNQNDRLNGIFELMAFVHKKFLILFDISTTEKSRLSKAFLELLQIRDSFTV